MAATMFTPEYLKKLSVMKAPSYEMGGDLDRFDDYLLFSYAELRNTAKDLLTDPDNNEAREKLSELISGLELELK